MTAEEHVFAIERPHRKLMTLYLIRSILSGPFIVISLPLLYFRYHTLRYRFDDEGIGMGWGILFRREVNLTYARIQDIHLTSGVLQRWLGLADIHIQTASGSAAAEMTIEGLLEYEMIRDFLYTKMRGYKAAGRDGRPVPVDRPAAPEPAGAVPAGSNEVVTLLKEIQEDIRATRLALEQSPPARGGDDV